MLFNLTFAIQSAVATVLFVSKPSALGSWDIVSPPERSSSNTHHVGLKCFSSVNCACPVRQKTMNLSKHSKSSIFPSELLNLLPIFITAFVAATRKRYPS